MPVIDSYPPSLHSGNPVIEVPLDVRKEESARSLLNAKTRPGADCGSDHELLIAKFRLKLKKMPCLGWGGLQRIEAAGDLPKEVMVKEGRAGDPQLSETPWEVP